MTSMNQRRLSSFRVAALALFASAQALSAQQDPVQLPRVAVTATRTELEGSALPFSVTVFNRTDLRDAGITSVSDVLRLVPGASVLSNGSVGSSASLFFRGGESDYVLVLIDGVPQNTPGGAFNFGSLTIDQIERVEVVRGPASVLYGSDAVSGVIQIFTRRGSGPPRLDLLAGGGSNGTMRVDGTLSGGRRQLAWSFGATHHQTDGILDFNSEFSNTVYSANLRWNGARGSLATALHYADNTFHYPTNSAGEVVDSNAYTAEGRLSTSIDAGWRVTPRVELRGRFAHLASDARTRDLPDFAADQESFVSDADVTRDVFELRAVAALGPQHVLTLAAESARDREESSSLSESEFGPFASSLTAERENVGLSAQLSGALSAGMHYVAGVRLDDNSEFGDFTTARIGLAQSLGTATTLRASYGNAFKAPPFYENFATGFVVGNPDLRPERSTSFEAGLHRVLARGRAAVGVTWYSQRFRDLIQYSGAVAQGEPNYHNLAEATSDGLEIEASLRMSRALLVRGSFTWLDTKVVDAGADDGPGAEYVNGERLLRRPSQLAGLTAEYSTPRGGKFGLIVTHTGERDDRNFSTFPATPIVMDAFTRVDASAVVPLRRNISRSGDLSLVVRLENLLDETYEQVLGFTAPGRTVFVGARIGS